MKRKTNFTLKAACYLIFAALLVWLAIYAYQALNDPYRTVPVTGISIRDTVPVTGIVVREEQVLYSVYSSVHIDLEDGRRVSAGGVVAEAFDSDEALLRAVRLAEKRRESEELTALLSAPADSTQQTDADIQAAIRRLRQSIAGRDFSAAETLSRTLQTQVFAAFSSTGDIQSRLSEVNGEIRQLEQAPADRSDAITAPVSGLFSASVDGWEELSASDLKQITPAALSALLAEERSAPEWSLGKIVSGVKWHYAVLVDAEDADRLRSQPQVPIVFGRYYGEQLTMNIEWISPAENGQRALLLSCSQSLSDVLGMRRQDAELLLSEENGLRIPRRALHADEDGRACVYVQTGLVAEKKIVQVCRDFGDSYMVTGDTLRVGDEVIVNAKGLREGKVVG